MFQSFYVLIFFALQTIAVIAAEDLFIPKSREEARAFTESPSVRISFEDLSNCDWLPDPVDPEKLAVLNSINKGESLSPHGLEDVPDLGFSWLFRISCDKTLA